MKEWRRQLAKRMALAPRLNPEVIGVDPLSVGFDGIDRSGKG
jgi:hypothetical protein